MDPQRKAYRAVKLCEDEVLNECMETARNQFYEDWLVAETVQEREEAHAKTLGLAEVLQHLTFLASTYDEPEKDEDEESAPDTP